MTSNLTELIRLTDQEMDAFLQEKGMRSPAYVPFPELDPGLTPLGSRVLVQVQTPRKISAGGIIKPDAVQEHDRYLSQLAIVRKVGPLAFKRRVTGEDWPEGAWVQPGDYVRVPLYGGDRMAFRTREGHIVLFLLLEDHTLIAKLTIPVEKFQEVALD